MRAIRMSVVALGVVFLAAIFCAAADAITKPAVSEEVSPVELLTAAARDGHEVTAVMRKPPGKGPFPAVIYLHGGLEQRPVIWLKEQVLSVPTLPRFLVSGYATVAATFRSRRVDMQNPETLWDALAIVERVKTIPEVDPESVVLWGDSGGGSLALEVAGETSLAAVSVQEPATVLFTGMFEGSGNDNRELNQQKMENPRQYYTPEIQKRTQQKIASVEAPIFIASGGKTVINRINDQIIIPELRQAGKEVEVTLYPDQPHGFSSGKGTPEAALKFFEDSHAFFKRHVSVQPNPVDESLVQRVPAVQEERPNQLSAVEKEAGWELLFDGETTAGWRAFGGDSFPVHRWTVERGSLKRIAGGERRAVDIITTRQFDDFELYWEWRIPADGNSGLKYFISEDRGGAIGHEYQIVGHEHDSRATNPLWKNGAFYDVLPAESAVMMPPGIFNQSRLIVQANHVEHWLNGVKVLEYELGSDRVSTAIARSKFKDVKGFGAKFKTPILLQDHGAEVRFRNIKIRQLRSDQEIDWAKAQKIRMKQRSGASLTDGETAYLRQAEEARRRRTETFRKENPPRESIGLMPLTELGKNTYKGFEGGLYPGGGNEPPPQHLQAGLEMARQIVPRDRGGRPAQDGKIVFISVGMSNTTQEFQVFQELAAGDSDINSALVIVDGAQGGQAADATADPGARYWQVLQQRLEQAGVTPAQVQAAWIKQAIGRPSQPFPAEAKGLQGYLVSTLHNLKESFPNLQIAYLSSRIYAGFAETPLNPEPHAYESGFSLKWLIADQMAGKPELNYDAEQGEVRSPWLAWGPYLWSDGTKGRGDGLVYTREDLAADGTHPSPAGRTKVGGQLLAFLRSARTARSWFLRDPEKPAPDKVNISYGPHERNVLDFWQARSGEPAPLVVYIHGGGFRAGDKSSIRPSLLNASLEAGFAVAAINYRLSDTASFPAFMLDGARAIQFLRSKAGEWKIDPARIAATGGSAGGGISMWLAFHDDLADPQSSDPVARQSTRLTCVGAFNTQSTYDPRAFRELGLAQAAQHPALPPFYGLSYEEFDTPPAYKLFEEAAPITYVSADDPPVFLFYRQENTPLPPDGTPSQAVHHPNLGEILKEKLDALGIEAVFHTGVKDMSGMDQEMVAFFKKQFDTDE